MRMCYNWYVIIVLQPLWQCKRWSFLLIQILTLIKNRSSKRHISRAEMEKGLFLCIHYMWAGKGDHFSRGFCFWPPTFGDATSRKWWIVLAGTDLWTQIARNQKSRTNQTIFESEYGGRPTGVVHGTPNHACFIQGATNLSWLTKPRQRVTIAVAFLQP